MAEPFVIDTEEVPSFDVPHHENTEAREPINPELGSTDVVFRLTTMRPGGQDYWHAHEGSEQLIFVRSGSGIVRMSQPKNEETQTVHDLEPGTFVYLPRQTFHQVKNDGDEPLEIIVIWAPPYESLDEWEPD